MNDKSILPRSYSDKLMKSLYARVAWFYDGWGRLTEDKALNRLLTLSEVEDGMDILEVAVGTGRLFEKLVARNPSGNNQGVDIAPSMLAHAKRRPARHAESDVYHLQEGSAYQLPFASDGFDRLFNSYMLDMFPLEDQPRVLEEFLRVPRPGGMMSIAYFSRGVTLVQSPLGVVGQVLSRTVDLLPAGGPAAAPETAWACGAGA